MNDILKELRRKQNEIESALGDIAHKTRALETDLSSIRTILLLYEQKVPHSEFKPHMSVRRQFGPYELRKFCLDGLRSTEDGTMDTRELALYAIRQKGLPEDRVIRKKIAMSVQQTMKTARRAGLVTSGGRKLGVVLWKLVEGDHS